MSGRLFGDRYFLCCLDEAHFYEAIRYVELNPYNAKIEYKPGEYYLNSALERLKTRSSFYLHKLPVYFEVNNWREYLNFECVWSAIKKSTLSGNPIGNNIFLDFVKLGFRSKNKDEFKLYGIP